ncbi:hypothetical protein LCGC14_1204100 [marine sediment metagenome]|uniref:Uncharacterized protein n=1 Tax=marine sediment metagenome TaxID=412755 RepID=A0A0F9M3G0_9ZZZZ
MTSRTTVWAKAVGNALDALQELKDLQEEYQEWQDNLPENFQDSPVSEKLQTVADLDLDSALEVVEEAEGLDLPLGFGRD